MGPELVVALSASLVAVVAAVLVVRAERRRQARLREELREARVHVDALEERLDRISEAVAESHRPRPEREYVVTTLAELEGTEAPPAGAGQLLEPQRSGSVAGVAHEVESRLLQALARQQAGSLLRVRRSAVDVVVKAVAAGHGVRRALRADVRDRAAAEAYVARRRSRRTRREELREARRLLRAVRAHEARAEDAA